MKKFVILILNRKDLIYMKNKIYILGIILIGITLIAVYATKKQVYDGDELYTYTLSNSKISGFMINNIKINEWNNPQDIENIFALNNDEILSFISIYKNQASDVHPPIYYLIFHITSIICLNKFSIIPGIIINIISYIITIIYLYKISKQIVDNKYVIFPSLLYTLSLGMLSTAMFIRMYMLLTMICTIFTYYFSEIYKEISNGKINKKNLIKLSICTYIGFMTHYFFLIYAFFISASFIIYLSIKKQIKQVIKYATHIIIPIIIGFVTFPFAYIHIFKGYRGTETQTNLIKSNIINNFKAIYDRLNKDIFLNIMIPLLIMTILLMIVWFIKNKQKKTKQNKFIIILSISTFLYTLLTIKIIPIQSTRYFYCIYPIIILILYYTISKTITNKYIKTLINILLLILSINAQIKYEPSWVNNYNKDLEQLKDKEIIYVIKDDYTTISDSQYLINFKKIYFTNEQFENYEIIEDCKKGIIIKTENIELINKIIDKTECKKYENQTFGYELKK